MSGLDGLEDRAPVDQFGDVGMGEDEGHGVVPIVVVVGMGYQVCATGCGHCWSVVSQRQRRYTKRLNAMSAAKPGSGAPIALWRVLPGDDRPPPRDVWYAVDRLPDWFSAAPTGNGCWYTIYLTADVRHYFFAKLAEMRDQAGPVDGAALGCESARGVGVRRAGDEAV